MLKLTVLLAVVAGMLVPSSAYAGGGNTELYSWRDKDENWMYVLLGGTNFQKNEKEIKESKNAVKGADAIKKKLAGLAKNEQVHWGAHRLEGFEFPEKDVIQALRDVATTAKVVLTTDLDEEEKPDRDVAEGEYAAPKTAKTTEEIVKAVEKIHRDLMGAVGGEPNVSTVESNIGGKKVFVAWHSPFSGVESCCAYIYALDPNAKVWTRTLSQTFDNTKSVSAEFSDGTVTLRNKSGKVVHTDPAPKKPEVKREAAPRFKGVEMYSWRDKDENWTYMLLDGTNALKSAKDIKESKNALKSAEAVKKVLAGLAKGEQVSWGAHELGGFEFPEKDVIKDIKKAAKAAELVFLVDKE